VKGGAGGGGLGGLRRSATPPGMPVCVAQLAAALAQSGHAPPLVQTAHVPVPELVLPAAAGRVQL